MPIELCAIINDYARPRGFCKSPMGKKMTEVFKKTHREWVDIQSYTEAEDERASCKQLNINMSKIDYKLCYNNFKTRFKKLSLYQLVLWVPTFERTSAVNNPSFIIKMFHLGVLDRMKYYADRL
tara:strand:+ start:1744 stop:2115 length:372 start_codon:yes stop_codon:yes gene_type:complete